MQRNQGKAFNQRNNKRHNNGQQAAGHTNGGNRFGGQHQKRSYNDHFEGN